MFQLGLPLEEIWKPVVGYEGLYEVSNYGNVASLNYRGRSGNRQLMRPWKHKEGYMIVDLCKERERKLFRIHRLVGEAFIPNPDNKPSIDHRNGVRDDNYFENLRWVTAKENMNFPLALENLSQPRTDEHKANISKALMGENNPKYDPNSLRQIHKRASEAGEYSQTLDNFRKTYKNSNHEKYELVLNLVKKYTI